MQHANEAKKEEMRKEFFEQSKFNPTHQRFGLFSFPGTLAISRQSYDEVRRSRRDNEGGVRTAPRNITSTSVKRGKGPEAYFSSLGYVSLEDPYRDPVKPQRAEHDRAKKAKSIHETPFKSSGPARSHAIIEYVPQGVPSKTSRRDAEGGVKFGPRNFYTGPGGLAYKHPEHIEDPYQRKNNFRRRANSVTHERAFRSMSSSSGTFNDNKSIYGEEGLSLQKKPPKQFKVNCYPHERPFLLPSRTKNGKEDSTFARFPESMPDPEPKPQRRAPDSRVPFKSACNSGTVPTPSVVSIVTNLKQEYPSAHIK